MFERLSPDFGAFNQNPPMCPHSPSLLLHTAASIKLPVPVWRRGGFEDTLTRQQWEAGANIHRALFSRHPTFSQDESADTWVRVGN